MPIIKWTETDRKPRYNHLHRKKRAQDRVEGYFRILLNCDQPPEMSDEDIRTYVASPTTKWIPDDES